MHLHGVPSSLSSLSVHRAYGELNHCKCIDLEMPRITDSIESKGTFFLIYFKTCLSSSTLYGTYDPFSYHFLTTVHGELRTDIFLIDRLATPTIYIVKHFQVDVRTLPGDWASSVCQSCSTHL